MSAAVQPERLLKELNQLWAESARQPGSSGHDVLRACSMTLLVLTERSRNATGVMETLAGLMPLYPCRLLVVEITNEPQRRLEASVRAHCWQTFGGRRQVCVEQVSFRAAAGAVADLPPVVRALIVPDLPVLLWCMQTDLLAREDAAALLQTAGKVIMDSGGAEPREVFARMESLRAAGLLVADLAWTRLTRWRELLAHTFAACSGDAPQPVDKVTVSHSGASPGTEALYLAGWLRSAFDPQPACVFAPAGDSELPPGRPAAVALEGPGLSLALAALGGGGVEVRANESVSWTRIEPRDETSLLEEELGIVGPDPVFEEAFQGAAELARAAL